MNIQVQKTEPFGVIVRPSEPQMHISKVDIAALKKLFLKHQLVVLRGFETFETSDEFASYCDLWGEVSLWPFGKVLELVEQDTPEDHIFDNSYVPMHWDGMYRPQVPEYQIFHCKKAPLQNQGGRTVFSNSLNVLKNTSTEQTKQWESLTGIYKRKMEFYDSKTVAPLISKHPLRGFSVIRWNEPHLPENGKFINPVEIEFKDVDASEAMGFHKQIKEAIYAPENSITHSWQDNDIVISDNFTLLHGREAFTSKSPRHIQRVQVLSNPVYENPGLESYK